MRKWFLFFFVFLFFLSACSGKQIHPMPPKPNPPKKEMTALDHLNKAIEVNKKMKGFISEYQARRIYNYYGQTKYTTTGRVSGMAEELQNPYASHEKARDFYGLEYTDDESWVIDGYKYFFVNDYYNPPEIYKIKFGEEVNYDLVVGALRIVESILGEMGANPKADGFSMQKENGMIRFNFDLHSFPKTMEKLDRAGDQLTGDVEYKKFQLKVYVDEKTYKLKKIVEVFEADIKDDQYILKEESSYIIKGEFTGKIEVPEHIKKSAVSE